MLRKSDLVPVLLRHYSDMDVRPSDLVVTSRERRLRAKRDDVRSLVRITPSVHVPLARLGKDAAPWVARRRVAEARLLSLPHRLKNSADFAVSGESALVALGLDTWWSNPDILIRRQKPSKSPLIFDGVLLPKTRVGPAVFRQISANRGLFPEENGTARTMVGSNICPEGLPITPPVIVVVDLWRTCHPLQALHDTSVLLRHLVNQDRTRLGQSRLVEETVRKSLLADLAELPGVWGGLGARALLAAADSGLESPAESAVLWALKCILPRGVMVRTQQPASVGGTTFYMDITLPELGVAIEATGVGKFGDSVKEARHVGSRFVRRQQLLADSGWNFIHVTYEQTKKPTRLVHYLQEKLAGFGASTHAPTGPLWAMPTPLLFHGSRKF